MKSKLIAALVAVGVGFGGCAFKTGDQVAQRQMDQLTPNRTTKSDAEKIVGFPDSKELLGDNELWTYKYEKMRTILGLYNEINTEKVVLEFSKNGVLLKRYKKAVKGNTELF